MANVRKNLAYYRALPYTRRMEHKEDEGEWASYWVANLNELPGCFATGKTRSEAIYNLNGIFDDYIEGLIELGDVIPEPAHPIIAQARQISEQTPQDQVDIYEVIKEPIISPRPRREAVRLRDAFKRDDELVRNSRSEIYAYS